MTSSKDIVFPVSTSSTRVPEQPPILRGNKGPGTARTPPGFFAGSGRSVARLKQLGFDPIERLVIRHDELSQELEYQKKRRSGEIIELRGDGKPKAFVMEHLLGVHDKLIAIERELLRYGYGRVPEVSEAERPKLPPLTIQLTKAGDKYVLNEDNFGPSTEEQPQGDPAPWD